jgi:hypothetical protein
MQAFPLLLLRCVPVFYFHYYGNVLSTVYVLLRTVILNQSATYVMILHHLQLFHRNVYFVALIFIRYLLLRCYLKSYPFTRYYSLSAYC